MMNDKRYLHMLMEAVGVKQLPQDLLASLVFQIPKQYKTGVKSPRDIDKLNSDTHKRFIKEGDKALLGFIKKMDLFFICDTDGNLSAISLNDKKVYAWNHEIGLFNSPGHMDKGAAQSYKKQGNNKNENLPPYPYKEWIKLMLAKKHPMHN